MLKGDAQCPQSLPSHHSLTTLHATDVQDFTAAGGMDFFSVSVGQVIITEALGQFLLAVRLWDLGDTHLSWRLTKSN